MIWFLLMMIKKPVTLFLLAIGLVAFYAYVTNQNANDVIQHFINLLVPLKNMLVKACTTLFPILLNELTEFIKGLNFNA